VLVTGFFMSLVEMYNILKIEMHYFTVQQRIHKCSFEIKAFFSNFIKWEKSQKLT